MTTGKLVSTGRKPLGMQIFNWYQCVDCKTEFPQEDSGSITCNGHVIGSCPWCRSDSQPYKNGRGL